jgi:hypothetical protein
VSATQAILYSIHDSVMLLAPRQWTQVDVHLVHGKVTELKTTGNTSNAPAPKPQLNIDLSAEAGTLSEAIAALVNELKASKKSLAPEVLRLQRQTEAVNVQLLMADRPVWFSRLQQNELDSLLITEELFDTLSGTERAFHDLQQQLQLKTAEVKDFRYDDGAAMLSVTSDGREQSCPAQLMGQYFRDDMLWIWGWNDAATNRAAVRKVESVCRPDAKPLGLAAFWRPVFHCDEGFAWALASSVAVSIGARGLFRGQVDGSALLFAPLRWPAP